MVVQGIIALALALPTGMLFGVGYGTGVRVGYEQVYPLLFPAQITTGRPDPKQTRENIKSINKIYDAIGGKEASQMGIAKGLSSAMSELDTNPDFRALMELELSASGNTRSRYGLDNKSQKPISSQEGFLSDTERLTASEALARNRLKTIEENIQFDKRNKLNQFAPLPQSTKKNLKIQSKLTTSSGLKLITMEYTKFGTSGRTKKVFIALRGNLAWHKRTLSKWRSSFKANPKGLTAATLFQKIKTYLTLLQRAYPNESFFKQKN